AEARMRAGVKRMLLGLVVEVLRRPKAKALRAGEREPVVPPGEPDPGGELLMLALLGSGTVCSIAFVAVYALDRLPRHTQLLGASLGLALLSFAAALIVFAKRLIVTGELEAAY